ncbi:MAG: NAD-dependent epimerase/dehydratase family protein [Pirellulales bacterium]
MRAFITGITGFAGGFLAEHLLACGDEVSGCSRRGVWPDWAANHLRHSIQLSRWDVGDVPGDDVKNSLAGFAPDCIYHLAALSVPGDCGAAEPTERAIEVNVRGTERVLELAAALPSAPRVLLTSTSHVYGKATKQHPIFTEQTPLAPHRGYGKTKQMTEGAVRRAILERGLDAIVVRAFQHTGPRQEPRLMLPEWAKQLAQPGIDRIQVKHLNTWVDLSDVRDVVRAYRQLAERGESGGVYNVGSGVRRRTGDILDLLITHAGVSPAVAELQPGTDKCDPIADIHRLQAATGWRPEITLERTIADTLEYWRQRVDG